MKGLATTRLVQTRLHTRSRGFIATAGSEEEGHKLLTDAPWLRPTHDSLGRRPRIQSALRDLTMIRNSLRPWSATSTIRSRMFVSKQRSGCGAEYYWQVDKRNRDVARLKRLARRLLNTETDSHGRRGVEESVYNLLDENTGYLSEWVRASSRMKIRMDQYGLRGPWWRTRRRCWPTVCARGHSRPQGSLKPRCGFSYRPYAWLT